MKYNQVLAPFLFFSIIVILLFVLLDTSTIGKLLFTFKSRDPEYFAEPASGSSIPYTTISHLKFITNQEHEETIDAALSVDDCKNSCTYEDTCIGYAFDSTKTKCKLVSDIDGYELNKETPLFLSSGLKNRPALVNPEAAPKFLQFSKKKLPMSDNGRISTNKNINRLDDCKLKCQDYNTPTEKCIAFEYDFKKRTCSLNSKVEGKMLDNTDTDSYLLIN